MWWGDVGRCTDTVKTTWDAGLAHQTMAIYQAAFAVCANVSSPPTSGDNCPAPPAERCCSRVLPAYSRQSSLFITLQKPASLSSVFLWTLPASGVRAPAVSSDGIDISVGSGPGGMMTGCFIGGAPAAVDARQGYIAQALVCGPWTAGTVVALDLPGLLGGESLGVRVCTRSAEEAGDGNAVLYLADGKA